MIVNIKGSAKGKSEVKGVCDAGKSVAAVTVKELVAALQKAPQEAQVFVRVGSGVFISAPATGWFSNAAESESKFFMIGE